MGEGAVWLEARSHPRAVEAYALATLLQLGDERPGSPYADEDAARPLAERIARLSDGNFLIAYLTALARGLYDEVPADPEQLTYTMDVRTALNQFLDRIEGVAGASAARLLTALAYAEAPGLTFELWIGAVQALYGTRLEEWALEEFTQSAAANFLIQSSQGPEPVFRLFHQALNDTLLNARAHRAVRDHKALTRAFLTDGRQVGWGSAPPYLLRSLPHHAGEAGMLDELLTDDEYLLHADLRRLASQAAQVTLTDAGTRRARLLRFTPHAAATEDPRERRALFSVTETLEKLGDSFGSAPGAAPYRARWSTAATRAERVAQQGHAGGVERVCPLALDGRVLLASAGDDGILRIWDPASGRQLRAMEGHAGQVWDIHAFTAEDQRTLLASAGTDAMVRIWDPAAGQQQRVLEGHVGTVRTVRSFTGEDHRTLLASSGEDGKILVWDLASGELRTTLQRRTAAGEAETSTVQAICALTTPDGRAALASAVADEAGEVGVWDPSTGHYRALGGTTPGGALELCPFISGGRAMLAAGGSDDMVRTWDLATGQRRAMASASIANAACAFTTGDGQSLLAIADGDGTILLRDLDTGDLRRTLVGHNLNIRAVSTFRLAGHTLLASCGEDSRVRVWDPATGQALWAIPVHLTPNAVTAVDGTLVVALSAGLLAIELNPQGSSNP